MAQGPTENIFLRMSKPVLINYSGPYGQVWNYLKTFYTSLLHS